MSETCAHIEETLVRILNRQATKEEISWFAAWIREGENRAYFEKFKKVWNLSSGGHATPEEIEAGWERYRDFILSSLRLRRYRRIVRGVVSAAAVVLVGLFVIPRFAQKDRAVMPFQPYKPGTAKEVVLTLSDGSEINISQQDTFQMAATADQSVTISKTERKKIVYAAATPGVEDEEEELSYNRVVVPAGMRFSVQLSDGTKAWLNSESSLRYPTRFGKGERCVEIQGNVYFEVAKDSTRPFVVTAPQLTTEVLGTAFEVNTYGDHDVLSVTLVEGSVKVRSPLRSAVISPDQQFIYDMGQQQAVVVLVDAKEKVRWKDGILSIRQESFDDVVWKLERWYGVTIENSTGQTFPQAFSGEFDEEDIHAAMQVLCTHLDITYTMEKERIVLKRK